MRGGEVRSSSLFSYVDLESRVPRDHPLRLIRVIVDTALARPNDDFEAIYAPIGRPSIPPEQLLRALLLQAFYTVRSERQLMQQLDYNMLFRWFVGLGIDDLFGRSDHQRPFKHNCPGLKWSSQKPPISVKNQIVSVAARYADENHSQAIDFSDSIFREGRLDDAESA
jgi:Transposase domain (DUF772)